MAEGSEIIKKRAQGARAIQLERFVDTGVITNSEMDSEDVKKYCPVDTTSQNLLKNAVDNLFLSARSYFRILKLARTIADLEEAKNISQKHVAEALQYRPKVE